MPAANAPSAPPAATPQTPAQTPMGTSFGDMEAYTTAEEGDSKAPESKSVANEPPAKPAKPTKGPQAKPTPAKPATPPATPPKEEEGEEDGEVKAPDSTQTEEGKEAETKPGEEGKPGRQSPWRLVESYKAKASQLERELAQLRTASTSKELPKEHQERLSSIEKRNQELEEEIRFVNYSKSKEYVETYQKPFEEAWGNAISELKELSITNEDGTSRVPTAQDMLALANMPLGQARATAKEWFGDAADDVMAHRRLLRELSDKQNKALENAKKTGSEREAKMMEERRARAKARSEELSQVWTAVNKEALEKYDYLRPAEGQPERNEKLKKAIKFVDETFSMNVNQAKTQEERDNIIKRHTALRNRAIGFSVLKHENNSLRAELAEAKKSLAEYQESEPSGGKPKSRESGEPSADSMEGTLAGMAKLAH